MDTDEVRDRTDIVRLIEASGVELRGNGNTLSGVCPFHEDKKPSLKVQPHKQWWWCYGCPDDGRSKVPGTGGDVFAWVMRRDDVDFMTAKQTLGEGNVALPIHRSPVVQPPKLSPFIPNMLVESCHMALRDRPGAVQWLVENKLWSEEAIDKYKIGFHADSYRFTIPIQSPTSNQWQDMRLYDPFGNHPQKMMPYHSGIGCLPLIYADNRDYVVIVEGEPDALAVASLGINVATNTCGAGSAERVWKTWFALVGTMPVVLCFDLDEAGDHALYGQGTHSKGLVGLFGKQCVVARLPEELGRKGDSTDAIRAFGPDWYREFIQKQLEVLRDEPTTIH